MDEPSSEPVMRLLSALTALEELDLQGAKITDRGLKHLELMKSLKDLNVAETAVSENGKASLQAALPGCNVHLESFFRI